MFALPDKIKIADLETTHPQYNPPVKTPSGELRGILDKHHDLYEGGERFEAAKSNYLIARMSDKLNANIRATRLANAAYISHVAAIIDDAAGGIFTDEPRLVVEGEQDEQDEAGKPVLDMPGMAQPNGNQRPANPKKPKDPRAEYWEDLNEDCDGHGCDFAAVLLRAITSCLIHRRAYLCVDFPEAPAANRAEAEKRGALDACLCEYDAREIDDWGEDEHGNLEWVRIHTVMPLREGAEPAKKEIHRWCYYTPELRRDYTAIKDIGPGGSWQDHADMAQGEPPKPHSYGELPVYRIEVPHALWIMNRAAAQQIAIFNASANCNELHTTTCLQMPVFTTDQDLSTVYLSQHHALRLRPQEAASFLSPSGSPFEQMRAYVEALTRELYSSLLAAQILAPSQTQNPRASGEAKEIDFRPSRTLKNVCRGILKDAASRAVKLIQKMRGEEDLDVDIKGLDAEGKDEEAQPQAGAPGAPPAFTKIPPGKTKGVNGQT